MPIEMGPLRRFTWTTMIQVRSVYSSSWLSGAAGSFSNAADTMPILWGRLGGLSRIAPPVVLSVISAEHRGAIGSTRRYSDRDWWEKGGCGEGVARGPGTKKRGRRSEERRGGKEGRRRGCAS